MGDMLRLSTARLFEPDALSAIDAYWRAANHCSVGQIYLLDNPLLAEPLRPEHIKPRLLGHFGTTAGVLCRALIIASDLLRYHVDRPARAFLDAQPTALAVVIVEAVTVAVRHLLDGVIRTDAEAIVASEAVTAR